MSEQQNEQIPDELKGLIPEFLKSRFSELDSILKSLETEDFEAIRKIAHDWKGYSRPYGFGELENYANQLREACIEANAQKIKAMLVEIRNYLSHKESTLDV